MSFETKDGRLWSIKQDLGHRIQVQDIMSPTGYSEWISEEELTSAMCPGMSQEQVSRIVRSRQFEKAQAKQGPHP